MKQVVLYALAAGITLSTGCSKEEDAPAAKTTAAPAESVLDPANSLAQQAQTTTEQLTQQAKQTTAQLSAKADEVTAQAQQAIEALSIKPEAVLEQLDNSIEDVKAKVASYSPEELLGFAGTYKDVILAKKDELLSLTEKLKELPMADKFSAKGLALTDQLNQYKDQLAGLKERYSVYLDKLEALGFNLSSFGL